MAYVLFDQEWICSYYMVLFATDMINKQYMRIKGEAAATSNGHMIIVGWNERVKHVVKQMHILQPNLRYRFN